ncbi:helix-turn-helix domain-containing protein [Actinocorallia sp. B10E7]|uniref:helix-turn-helix domain-containing protein n=1 Tax=Actinocorallia sp. B10E7 TaxID=3153558 RepID=UPI00325C9374
MANKADPLAEFLSPAELAEVERRSARLRAGLRLGELRKRLGFTQEQVAGRMGITQRRVSAIETAALNDIKVPTLVAYLETMGAEIDLGARFEGGDRVELRANPRRSSVR